ncbi:MAG: ATP-binding protein [Richelia sp. RM2_1_2]|nr:ATP-binding protein [Richelia sp. RM2_1_2]
MKNINQLLAYTLQFIPVVKAVNQVLAKTPAEQIIYRVSQLAEAPFDWNLVRFVSADLNEKLKSEAIRGIPFLPMKRRLQNRFSAEIRLDSLVCASAAGFWYLHEKKPAQAEEAFAVVRSILYGEEIYILAQTLTIFQGTKDFDDIARIFVETRYIASLQSSQENLLRPNTWQAISKLHRVVEDAQLVKRSVSRATRAFALNHAQGELTNILNNSQTLPQAERGLIIDIAETWQKALLQIAGEVGEVTIAQPIRNPYIIGDPVMGEKFVGREEVMRELEELWLRGEQLQSVVIYGHRRMGKTSILRNAADSVGSGVRLAYVNMLIAGNISEGVGEVLMAICDAVSEAVNIPPPDDDKLLQLPEITFKRYLKQVVETFHATSLRGLIIAIDEFEKIEELIAAGKISENFLGYLRGLLQMNSQVAFAFAGLHTLEEMTADYFQPFFASVIPIHVGFMEPAVTRQILANPVEFSDNNVETLYITSPDVTSSQEDFLLDYKPEALDKIYEFTHGQPYLVQLIGFVLVRRYNDQVFEMGRKRDPVFTVEDVEAVVNNTEFFKRGRYYFDGVWSQAAQGAEGQQAILRVLAPHPQGLSYEDVMGEVSKEGFDEESLQAAIKTLKNHDVVKDTQGRLCIIVELFRRWLVKEM